MEEDKIQIIPKDVMKDVYLNRFPPDIKKWYEKSTIPKKLICDVKKPQVGKNFINTAPRLLKERKAFSSFTKKSRDGVHKMIDFVKEVWCENNDKILLYLLKWCADVLKGKKNSTIPYIKAIEGVGKSTFIEFFIEFVLGTEFYAKGDKECLVSQFNMDLMGKSFVVFEELPTMNKGEWNVCDGKLKDMATGKEMNYRDLYQRKIRAANINNYVILTNHKAIKRPDGRRYFVITMNAKYCNNHEFFADLRNTCFNEKVGYAFYNYLMELDTDDFNSLDMPDTTSKLDMIADLLSPIEKFLKTEFLLPHRPIKMKIKELYEKYEKYCDHNGLKSETPAEFRTGMSQYGFNFKLISGYNCYRISVDQLKAVATKRKWVHMLDKDFVEGAILFGDDGEDTNFGTDVPDNSVDMSEEYAELKKKYNSVLAKFNSTRRRGFGIVIKRPEDEMEVEYDSKKGLRSESDSDSDSDSDDEDIVVSKKSSTKRKTYPKLKLANV
eukprot:scaffold7211_cov247-Ochromonas_danica.AAC.10